MYLRYARWATDKYILLMLGLFPLHCGFRVHAYESITEAKLYFFLAATLGWLLAVVILTALAGIKREPLRPQIRPAHLAMGLFLVFGAVSAAVSDYGAVCLLGAGRYDGYLMIVLYAAAFFGVSLLAEPRPRYAWALGVSVTVCCVIAALQLFGLDPLRLYPESMNYYDKYERMNSAFLGTLGNAGLLAAYLTLAAPFVTVYGVLSERKRDRLLLIPGALAVAILLLCDVDAGVAALFGCVLVTVPVVIRNRRAARIAGCVSGGATVLGLGVLYFWPGTSGTLWEISEVLHGRLSDEFGSHRGEIWKQAWALFREKPWFGSGPGTVSDRFTIRWSRYIEALGRDRVVGVDNAHNVFLGYLVNIGVFGALSYIAAFVSSTVTWLRRRDDALYAAIGSALLCYMIQEFFGLGIVVTEPMLFVVWGLLESTKSEDIENTGSVSTE